MYSIRFFKAIILGGFLLPAALLADPIALKGSVHEDYRGTPRLDFPDAVASKVKSAGDYLRAQSARFKLPADMSNLEIVNVRQSLVGSHTRYRQMLNGLPVETAEIIVSQRTADGSVYQVYNNTYPVVTPVPAAKTVIGKDAALQKSWEHLRVYGRLQFLPKAELVYMPEKTGFRLVYKTLVSVDGPLGFWEQKIDALSGDVISVRRHEISEKPEAAAIPDFSAYLGPVKSMQAEVSRLEAAVQAQKKASGVSNKTTVDGTALVFDPDPRTTLANDALLNTTAAAAFNAAYFTRPLRQITLDAGVYYLQGPWVSIVSLASELPSTAVSTTADGNWTAKRGNNAFNDAMCYFHIDQNQRYLQSLGYTGATGLQEGSISIDSDGLDGADNSWYVPSQNYIAFGHGGVDDDEDADVILHEYGHALTQDATPGWGGGDSGAIGEGFGDYWGASYSWTCVNGSTYHPAWAFSWDGHSADTWAGRFLDKTSLTYDYNHTYVDHETISGIANYSDQLWGTPIYQAFKDLIGLGRPRTEMDTIIIESFFGVGSGVKMRDMANATVKVAAELFPDGPHAATYYTRFANQLILTTYPLPDPTLIYPVGDEIFAAGSTINVQWNRNGALSKAATRIEYTSQRGGGAATFFDQVESGVNGWVASKTGGSDWAITTSDSYSPTRSWFAANDTTACEQYLAHSSITVASGAVLSFWHSYNLESGYDGAVVEISTNGTTWVDVGTNATQNGYNSTISASDGSAIAGRKAFSGSSGGFVETRIPLTRYEGKTVQIRFRETDDGSYATTGWWVDDIKTFVDATWLTVITTPTNTSSYAWTLPVTPGTNYGVRVKLVGSNCTDSGWATSSAFALVVGANQAPTDMSLSSSRLPENKPVGTLVGAFGTQDPDVGNTFMYALTNGTGDTDNGSFSISGSNLLAAAVFDYETKTNLSIRVRSTDQGGLWFEKSFIVAVTNLNDFYKLTLTSAHGGSVPSGTNSFHLNTALSVAVTNSPFYNGTTQYLCTGWTGTGSVPPLGSTTNTGAFYMTNDSTLVWQWTTNYWLNTATSGAGSVDVLDGWWSKGATTQITAVSDDHYHFSGWSGQTNGCTVNSNVITVPMTRPRAITANFALDQHALIVSTRHGKANPAVGTNLYNWGSVLSAALTNSPVMSGTTQYVCAGWAGTGSVPVSGLTTNTGPFTLTNSSSIVWQWSTNYWLKVLTNGSGTVSANTNWYPSGTNVTVTATPGTTWRFNGWTGQTNGCVVSDNTISVLMNQARTTVTANFIRQYSLVVTTPYGMGVPPAGTNWVDTGTSVKAAIVNSPVINGTTQYVCRGWSGTGSVTASGTTTNTAAIAITANSTITWLWRTNYWLDVSSTGQGRLSTNDCWLGKGTNLLITATASNHWHFAGWSGQTDGCVISSNKITVLMDAPRAVVSAFEIDRHKIIVTTPYGMSSPGKGTNWFDYGSTNYVAVTNAPVMNGETQYVCKGWVGTGSLPAGGVTTNTGLFKLTNDSSIVWSWQTNYWMNTDVEGGGTVSVNDGWLVRGTNIQVIATASNFWYFGNWNGTTNGGTITSNRITVAMSGPRQLTAVLKPYLATNNVPKWWLFQYGLTNFNSNAMQDADGDGMQTWEEWVAGSDPTNSSSSFMFTFIGGEPVVGNTLRWPSIPNRFYSLTRSTNLSAGAGGFTFVPAASNMPATPPENSYLDGVAQPGPVFYRIRVRE